MVLSSIFIPDACNEKSSMDAVVVSIESNVEVVYGVRKSDVTVQILKLAIGYAFRQNILLSYLELAGPDQREILSQPVMPVNASEHAWKSLSGINLHQSSIRCAQSGCGGSLWMNMRTYRRLKRCFDMGMPPILTASEAYAYWSIQRGYY